MANSESIMHQSICVKLINIPPLPSHLQPTGIGLLSMPAVEVEVGGGNLILQYGGAWQANGFERKVYKKVTVAYRAIHKKEFDSQMWYFSGALNTIFSCGRVWEFEQTNL